MSDTHMHTDKILAALEPMFAEAEEKGLWFYASSIFTDFWISPKSLRKAHAEGRYIWHPKNWVLLDPGKRIAYPEEKIAEMQREINDINNQK